MPFRYTRSLTMGTFDVFHLGHMRMLRWMRDNSDHVTVGLNTDEFIAEFKGKPPIFTLEERLEMLKLTGLVDRFLINYSGHSYPILLVERPDVLVVGTDWLPRERYLKQIGVTEEEMKKLGTSLFFFNSEFAPHGTDIKKAILA